MNKVIEFLENEKLQMDRYIEMVSGKVSDEDYILREEIIKAIEILKSQ